MSIKFETEGHDVSKFDTYYSQADGRGFSLEDPPLKIYYFNKYGGWKDEIDGKVYYYDQDCNPKIDNIPTDIDEPQEQYNQDNEGQESATNQNQQEQYFQEIQQDLKDYSASSDEEEEDQEENQKALDEMTSSSEEEQEEEDKEEEEDNQEKQRNKERQRNNVKNNAQQVIYEEKQEDNVEEETKQIKNESEYEDEQDGKSCSNEQTDESDDSEHFRMEYIDELLDTIDQNDIETTCIQVEKIPADYTEDNLLLSLGITDQEQAMKILYIFYSPVEKDIDDEDEDEEQDQEQIDVRNAVLVVSDKQIARQLVQKEGKSLHQSEDRLLYLDVLVQPRDYYPKPCFNDLIYVKLINIIKQISSPQSLNKMLAFHLTNLESEKEMIGKLIDIVQNVQYKELQNEFTLEISLLTTQQPILDIISCWNQLCVFNIITNIQDITLY